MKKLSVLFALVLFSHYSINAQDKGKIKVGLDLGYAFAKGGGGLLFSLEPKYNLTDNSDIGLRLGVAAYGRELNGNDLSIEFNSNFLATYEYYFHKEGTSSAPFLGFGLGVYQLSGFSLVDVFSNGDVKDESKFGGMIRGGIELGKFRLALEYNLVPKTDIDTDWSVKNSYLGVSIGFYIGGGKWKKQSN